MLDSSNGSRTSYSSEFSIDKMFGLSDSTSTDEPT